MTIQRGCIDLGCAGRPAGIHGQLWARSIAPQDLSRILQTGQVGIGRMNVQAEPKTAAFAMYIPIRDANKTVVGAVAGSIRLDKPNFLTDLASHRYGKDRQLLLAGGGATLIFAHRTNHVYWKSFHHGASVPGLTDLWMASKVPRACSQSPWGRSAGQH